MLTDCGVCRCPRRSRYRGARGEPGDRAAREVEHRNSLSTSGGARRAAREGGEARLRRWIRCRGWRRIGGAAVGGGEVMTVTEGRRASQRGVVARNSRSRRSATMDRAPLSVRVLCQSISGRRPFAECIAYLLHYFKTGETTTSNHKSSKNVVSQGGQAGCPYTPACSQR